MSKQNRVDFNQIKNVLVIKLRHHGDVLLTTPVFETLKTQFPHLQVDALVYKDSIAMLQNNPFIDQIHVVDRQAKKEGFKHQWQTESSLLSALRNRHYDLIIHLTEHWRGAWLSLLLQPSFAVSQEYPRRQSLFWRKAFPVRYSIPKNYQRHTIEIHLDALRVIGVDVGEESRNLSWQVSEEERQRQTELVANTNSKSYVVIHPTSRWLFKCWEENKVALLIDQLHQKNISIVVTSGPDKKELGMVDRILSSLKTTHPTNLAGKLTLRELGAIIEGASLFIGVDSAPMHMATAVKTPSVTLFGPSSENEWGPRGEDHKVIVSDHSCRPCRMDGCANSKKSDCLTSLPVKQIMDACLPVIRKMDLSRA